MSSMLVLGWLATTGLACPSPPAAGPQLATARAGVPETLYVNFGGAVLRSDCGNDARYDCSTLSDTFDDYVGPFTGNATQRMAILQAARNGAADFGIRIVTRRPPEDVPYTMVVYGDIGPQSFAGQTVFDLFGPAVPDVQPPELAIEFPADGAVFVAPVTFTLREDRFIGSERRAERLRRRPPMHPAHGMARPGGSRSDHVRRTQDTDALKLGSTSRSKN